VLGSGSFFSIATSKLSCLLHSVPSPLSPETKTKDRFLLVQGEEALEVMSFSPPPSPLPQISANSRSSQASSASWPHDSVKLRRLWTNISAQNCSILAMIRLVVELWGPMILLSSFQHTLELFECRFEVCLRIAVLWVLLLPRKWEEPPPNQSSSEPPPNQSSSLETTATSQVLAPVTPHWILPERASLGLCCWLRHWQHQMNPWWWFHQPRPANSWGCKSVSSGCSTGWQTVARIYDFTLRMEMLETGGFTSAGARCH